MIEDYDNVDYDYFKEWDIEQYKKELERLNKELEQEKKDFKEANDKCFELTLENKRLNNIINKAIKYVESLSSCGRGCDIYDDIKQEILKELKGSDKE